MILSGRLAETADLVSIEVGEGKITRIAPAPDDSAAGHFVVAPGFIDMQVNGFAGFDFCDPAVTTAEIRQLIGRLQERGVTTLCPTVVTGSHEQMAASIGAIARACEEDSAVGRAVACIHVEGPYISPEDGPRGAHAQEHVRPPDWAEFQRWQELAGGRIGMVTLSPEYPEAPDFIRRATGAGVLVSIGHTGADTEAIAQAVEAGARFSTHLGNGAHALIRRHPNYIWDQLADDRLMAGLIFDGHHLPPSVMKVMLRAKSLERCVLVSDAVAVAGLPPGIYEGRVGKRVELLPSGRLVLQGTPYLAGSASHLLDGVNNAIALAGLSTGEAIRLATTNPARAMGLEQRLGAILPGADANLVLLEQDSVSGLLSVAATMVAGEWVHKRKGMDLS
ncbi:MAG: N-acetylglucosamine-6-phosphate deacetylase [Bacillota bacterium]